MCVCLIFFQEIVTALESNCNIIPILDNCDWPEPEQLPEDMRQICYFNAIRYAVTEPYYPTHFHYTDKLLSYTQG